MWVTQISSWSLGLKFFADIIRNYNVWSNNYFAYEAALFNKRLRETVSLYLTRVLY